MLAANATKINVLSLNGPGDAQPLQSVDIAGPAEAVGLTISTSIIDPIANDVAYQHFV